MCHASNTQREGKTVSHRKSSIGEQYSRGNIDIGASCGEMDENKAE